MKVTLAYEYAGHKPDATVELSDDEAQRLIQDGRARRASKYRQAEKVEPDTNTEEH